METKLKELRLDAQELSEVLTKVNRPKVKDLLSLDLRKVQTDIIAIEDSLKTSGPTPSKTTTIVPNTASRKPVDVYIKNYSWEESDNYVKVYIMNLKNVQSLTAPGDVVTEFTPTSVHMKICNLDGKNHIFNLKQTAEEFNADKSYIKVKTDMVVLFVKKCSPSKWGCLTKSEKLAAEEKANKFKPQSDNSGDPQASLMEMMKQMYENGDDEMKRTMLKSFAENPGYNKL